MSTGFFFGTNKADTLYGNQDVSDYMFGYSGNDLIVGGSGLTESDFILGGNGDDFLQGWSGNDGLYGGNGNDLIGMVNGSNMVYGGNGKDTFILSANQNRVEEKAEGPVLSVILDFNPLLDTLNITNADKFGIDFVKGDDGVFVVNGEGNAIVLLQGLYTTSMIDVDTQPLLGVGWDAAEDMFGA